MLAWFRGTMGRFDQKFCVWTWSIWLWSPSFGLYNNTRVRTHTQCMISSVSDCDICLVSGFFGWAKTNTQGRIFWQSGTEQLFAPFLLTAPSSKGDQWLSLFSPCAVYSQSKSCSFSFSLQLQWLQWMGFWPCWYTRCRMDLHLSHCRCLSHLFHWSMKSC